MGSSWKILLRGEVGYSDADVSNLQLDLTDRTVQLSVTDLPNLYRFKAGGSRSVRGYGFEDLSNNAIGSNNIITASAEVEWNFRPDWSMAAFFDIGNAFAPREIAYWVPPIPERMVDPRPNVTHAAKTCDLYVRPDGLMYVTDWNGGLNVLQYLG